VERRSPGLPGALSGPQDMPMPAFLVGSLCIVTALVLNEWTIARLLSLEGGLEPQALRLSVWGFQLVATVAGIILMRRGRQLSRAWLLALPIPAVGLLAGVEGTTRAVLKRNQLPLHTTSTELGWRTAEYVRLGYRHPAFGLVQVSTGPHGFRRFGDTTSREPRILFIGDSYTEAFQVSDGEAYYDRIAELVASVQIFAYGTGGYGTLQEYMVLDRRFDAIDPDLVVWQFSANDLLNNDHYLESRSPLSSRMTRPYYENGRVAYRFDGSGLLSRYSRLVLFVDARVAMLKGQGFQPVDLMRERTHEPEALQRSIRTTDAILHLVSTRVAQIPVLAFAAEGDRFADSVFAELARKQGWRYVAGIPDSVAAAKASGLTVDGLPRDGHWNSRGHAIAGRVLAREIGPMLHRAAERPPGP
jgi:hypothetical protein